MKLNYSLGILAIFWSPPFKNKPFCASSDLHFEPNLACFGLNLSVLNYFEIKLTKNVENWLKIGFIYILTQTKLLWQKLWYQNHSVSFQIPLWAKKNKFRDIFEKNRVYVRFWENSEFLWKTGFCIILRKLRIFVKNLVFVWFWENSEFLWKTGFCIILKKFGVFVKIWFLYDFVKTPSFCEKSQFCWWRWEKAILKWK